jgi:hypothetical protein
METTCGGSGMNNFECPRCGHCCHVEEEHMTDRELMQQALEALESDPISHAGLVSRKQAITALRQALETDLARVGEVGVWGTVQCEPQEEVEDGWCDWVCPKPRGYLMQCCDCELIHEVDFRVVQYEPKPSEMYEVVDDPNLQAQMRLKRRDDLSPKRQWVGLTDQEINSVCYNRDWTAPWTDTTFARAIEQALKDKNT